MAKKRRFYLIAILAVTAGFVPFVIEHDLRFAVAGVAVFLAIVALKHSGYQVALVNEENFMQDIHGEEGSVSRESTETLKKIHNILTLELVPIREQLKRQQEVIDNSVENLNSSFFGMQDAVGNQGRLAQHMVKDLLDNDDNEFSLTKVMPETEHAIDNYIDLLVQVSEKSITAIHCIHDMSEKLDAVFKLLA